MIAIEKRGEFFKVAGKLIYGWALVCEQKNASGEWERYVDTQNDHVPEDVMVDAALDFAKNSRIGKDMHAGERVANVPFVYVVTKASTSLGIETKKTGMLIGWEPDDPALVEAVARGERTGFSIGGFVHESDNVIGKVAKTGSREGREADEKPPRVFRRFEINEISLVDMPAMEGATIGYFKNADGTARRVIAKRLEKSGEPIDLEVLRRELTEQGNAAIAALGARLALLESATTAKSTLSITAPTVDATKDTTMKIIVLTEAQHAHYTKLATDERDAFLEKSETERTQIVKAAIDADPIVYTTDDGMQLRKSAGDALIAMAKKADDANKLAKSERDQRELSELTKRAADTLGHLAGTTAAHVALLKAAESIADETLRADAIAALKVADAIMASKSIPGGGNGHEDPTLTAPAQRFDDLVTKHMAAHKVTKGAATEAVLNTAEGKAAYAELRKQIVGRK